jgi:hypothetical protein
MADFARFLPLSQRPRDSEAGVSGDRRTALADLVDRASELVRDNGRRPAVLIEEFVSDAGLRWEYEALTADDPAAALAALATIVRTGRRRNTRALAAATRALLLLARALDAEVTLSPDTAGAVALYLAAAGPFDRRAVVKGHTIRATDADWAFGNGPVLDGTATGIAAFLAGATDVPPQPPAITDRG